MASILNTNVLVSARDEYSNQLKRHLFPLIQEGIESIYTDSVTEDEYNPLKQFQIFLKQVPNWNQTILEGETNRIKDKCPYLMDMVTAIFVSHVKILASVRLGGNHSNIKIKIPTPEIFIHSIYVAAAECFYYDPMPFSDTLDRTNYEKIKETIETNIDDTISAMIPIQSILQEYLCNTFTDHVKQSLPSDPIPPVSPVPQDFGDVLSGTDIMNQIDDPVPTQPDIPMDELPNLGELFTPVDSPVDSDPIFGIGDSTPFSDKVVDDDLFSGNLDSLDGIDTSDTPIDNEAGEVKELNFLDFGGDEPSDEKEKEIEPVDFSDNVIPADQDTFGFNDTAGDDSNGRGDDEFNFF
jgi:hypothetical protein